MLLHEYDGDLQRTLAALLDGTAHDIKQCRPLHRYHFPECDTWTNEEIDAFTRAMEMSEKNFQQISQAVSSSNRSHRADRSSSSGWDEKRQAMHRILLHAQSQSQCSIHRVWDRLHCAGCQTKTLTDDQEQTAETDA